MYGENPINNEALEKIAKKFGLTSNDIEISDGIQDNSLLDLIRPGFCNLPVALSNIAKSGLYKNEKDFATASNKLSRIEKRYASELDKYNTNICDHPATIQVKKSHRVLASLFSLYVHDAMEINFITHMIEELVPVVHHEYKSITNIKLPAYNEADFNILKPSKSLYFKNRAATFIWLYKKYYGQGKKLLEPEPAKGIKLIDSYSEYAIKHANKKPDSIELYNKHFSAWIYENIFVTKAKMFNNKTLTFEDFYSKLNKALPDGWFLGRPNYNWLVADGLFKPFEGFFDSDISFVKKDEEQEDPNYRYNVIPIFKSLDNGKRWLYVANFIYEGYDRNPNTEPLVLLDNNDVNGWKIAWSIALNDGEQLLNPYLTKIRELSGFSRLPMVYSKYPTYDNNVTTIITHTQFIDLK